MADPRIERRAKLAALPALVVTLVVLVVPAGMLIARGVAGAPPVPGLRAALVGTLTVSIVAATLSSLLALGIAAATRLAGPRAEAIVTTVSAIPLSLSALVTAFAFMLLFGRSGTVPLLVARAGGDPHWLSDAFYGPAGLVLVYLHILIPRALMILMPVVTGLDLAVFRVARVLGAGPMRAARDALLPQIIPAWLSAWSLCFAVGAGSYAAALVLLGTKATLLPVLLVAQLSDAATDTRAAGWVAGVIVVLCTTGAIATQAIIRRRRS